ncbi:MAG: tetratricopeptide repeat protein [Candidatus Neomarinimicrobiota bacterium]
MFRYLIIIISVISLTFITGQDTLTTPETDNQVLPDSISITGADDTVADSLPVEAAAEDVIDTIEAIEPIVESAVASEPVISADDTADEPAAEAPEEETEIEAPVAKVEAVSLMELLPADVIGELFTEEALEESFFQYLKYLDGYAAISVGGLFGMLGSSEDINAYKIAEYERYLNTYFPGNHSDQIQNFIIKCNITRAAWDEVTVGIVKFLCLYPESAIFRSVRQTGIELVEAEKYFREQKQIYVDLFNGIKNTGSEITDRYYTFLKTIRLLKIESQAVILNRETLDFINRYPNSNRTSEIILWLAEADFALEDYNASYLGYQKILTMYSRSNKLAYALYRSGIIQSDKFGQFDEAITTFRNFLLRFPSDSLAAKAQYKIADIADTKLKDWVQAVNEYQVFVDTYPTHRKAAASLMRLGEIQDKELNQVNEAITTYHSVVQFYPQAPQAVEALLRSGQVFEANKRYAEAVEEYFAVYQKYPDAVETLDALAKCADLYEKRLKDNGKVKEILTIIVKTYPESKSAKAAEKKLSKL